MRKISVMLLLLAGFSFSLSAGDIIREFSSRVASSCVSFDYSFSVSGETPVTGAGGVIFQNDCYKMLSSGMEIWCDGRTRWTVDHSSEEAYIETVDPSSTDYVSNPSALILAVGSVFTQTSLKPSTFNGKSATSVTLVPSVSGTGLSQVVMYFSADNVPVGAVITVDDGTRATFVIKNFSAAPLSGQSFSYDVKRLGKTYVVTDLR